MDKLGAAALSTLATALAIVAAAVLTYLASKLWYWLQYRKRIPIVLHASPHPAGASRTPPTTPDPTVAALVASLTEFIAADPPGPLAPGGLESTAPTMNTVPFENGTHWLATVASLALARRPGYHLHLTIHEGAGPTGPEQPDRPRRITATVLDRARGVVVASRGFNTNESNLVAKIGCFCIFHVQAQRRVARWIPRWERWNFESSYYAYREGLRLHADGVAILKEAVELTAAGHTNVAARRAATGRKRLERAAARFRTACVTDLSNVQARLARASILEFLNKRAEATKIYAGCRDLWPENIETTYRLMAATQVDRQLRYRAKRRAAEGATADGAEAGAPHLPRQATPPEIEQPDGAARPAGRGAPQVTAPAIVELSLPDTVAELRRQLAWRRLVRRWIRTWHPKRFNPGERRYWSGWFRPWNPGAPLTSLRFKRTEFLAAVEVVNLIVALHDLLEERQPVNGTAPGAPGVPAHKPDGTAPQAVQDQARGLFEELSCQVIGRREDGAGWLLHPEEMAQLRDRDASRAGPTDLPVDHDEAWHRDGAEDRTAPLGAHAPKATIGWLAHYNAVCFLSLASTLEAANRPWSCPDDHQWQHDCFTAALRELGRVMRDPYSDLDASWLDSEPDLAPMRAALQQLARNGSTNALATFFEYSGRTVTDGTSGQQPATPRPLQPSRSGLPGRPRAG